jgi:hypothetical protein
MDVLWKVDSSLKKKAVGAVPHIEIEAPLQNPVEANSKRVGMTHPCPVPVSHPYG